MSRKYQRGFTLIELLLVLALIGLVLAAGWNLFAVAQKAWDSFQTRQEAEAAVRLVSQVINNEINYASFLEIRKAADNWQTSELREKDRMIFSNDTGDTIVLREYDGSNYVDTTIVYTEKSTLELSFSKPADNSGAYLDNMLSYKITARHKDQNGEDEDGDGTPEKAEIFSTHSSITISNMISGLGFPISNKSLYSQSSNCTPGERILYRTTFDRYTPSAPGSDFTCGL